MTRLVDIAPPIAPATPSTTGAEIYERFQHEPDTLAIAVTDHDGRPVGLIERNTFLAQMAAQHGYALWAKRPISSLIKTEGLVVDGEVTVAEFCGGILQERPSELLHGFIVTRQGRYAGVGTMLALLQAAAAVAHSSTRQAQDALAARSRFLAVMSHEIRTPLNGVLAVAEIVRRKSRQANLDPLLCTILESGGVLLRLLNDALDLSRAETADLTLSKAPFVVPPLLNEILQLWTPQAEIKGVRLEATYEGPADLWVVGDGVRLRQILNNLLSNAIKFTGQGAVTVRLVAEDNEAGCRLRGEVADSGSGIPADQMEAIFAPFQQTEEGARRGGAGLGLAVCRQLVELMEGTIVARPNAGGGALFAFDLRVERSATPDETSDFETTAASGQESRSAHILIADDNATNRLVVESLCEIFGCTSESVADGAQAVKAAISGRFDLVLMDIKMPEMDGAEATRIIRSGIGATSQLPIIALTANADPTDAAFYRRCGMNGVVQKPIQPEQLLQAMNAVLSIGGVEKEAAELVA